MGSSRSTRKIQRAVAGSQIVAQSVGSFLPAASIPIKFAQALGSFGMFCRKRDAMPRDRAFYFFQAVISTAQVIVATMLIYNNQTCSSESTDKLCISAMYLMLMYNGTLLTGWGMSEALRQSELGGSEGSSYSGSQPTSSSIDMAPHGSHESLAEQRNSPADGALNDHAAPPIELHTPRTSPRLEHTRHGGSSVFASAKDEPVGSSGLSHQTSSH